MAGINAPIKTGNGVFFKPGSVGAGPPEKTANAYLENRITNKRLLLWVYDFTSDFSATGTEAQSRTRKEFYPRFFTQPRYVIKGQTPNQYEWQRLGEFIRQGMLMQVMSSAVQSNPQFEAFVLRIEGRGYATKNRNTKGGHAGWTLEGYIEEAPAGGERFEFAPEYEFTFILANATEGPMKVLDQTYLPEQIANVRERYLSGFAKPLPEPEKDGSKNKPPKTPTEILNAFGDN